jgi:hypothetical protein
MTLSLLQQSLRPLLLAMVTMKATTNPPQQLGVSYVRACLLPPLDFQEFVFPSRGQ